MVSSETVSSETVSSETVSSETPETPGGQHTRKHTSLPPDMVNGDPTVAGTNLELRPPVARLLADPQFVKWLDSPEAGLSLQGTLSESDVRYLRACLVAKRQNDAANEERRRLGRLLEAVEAVKAAAL